MGQVENLNETIRRVIHGVGCWCENGLDLMYRGMPETIHIVLTRPEIVLVLGWGIQRRGEPYCVIFVSVL